MAMGDGGPHVQVAAFCEKALPGPSLSLINLVDSIGVAGPPGDEMPALSLQSITLVICLWADQTKGRYALKLRPETPKAEQLDPIELPINFPDTGAKGLNIVTQVPFTVDEEGTYWFDVLFDPGHDQEPRLLSRIPLTVNYQPTVTLPGG